MNKNLIGFGILAIIVLVSAIATEDLNLVECSPANISTNHEGELLNLTGVIKEIVQAAGSMSERRYVIIDTGTEKYVIDAPEGLFGGTETFKLLLNKNVSLSGYFSPTPNPRYETTELFVIEIDGYTKKCCYTKINESEIPNYRSIIESIKSDIEDMKNIEKNHEYDRLRQMYICGEVALENCPAHIILDWQKEIDRYQYMIDHKHSQEQTCMWMKNE
jgi:hypothetical protein